MLFGDVCQDVEDILPWHPHVDEGRFGWHIHKRRRQRRRIAALADDLDSRAASCVLPDQTPRERFVVGDDQANSVRHREAPSANRDLPRIRRRPVLR